MKNRKELIKSKGFSINMIEEINTKEDPFLPTVDYNKIKIGARKISDATLELGDFVKGDSQLADKQHVLNAIRNLDYPELRTISQYFYRASGIYGRLCRYVAGLYKYDWFLTPYLTKKRSDKTKNAKQLQKINDEMLEKFYEILYYLDNLKIKQLFGKIALKVVINGCYYGYLIEGKNKTVIQELPISYCRSRFQTNGKPAVEFNMSYFDKYFKDATYRAQILAMYPKDFQKGYDLYKQKKLPPLFKGDTEGWYLLDPRAAVKFNIGDDDFPNFISVIPAIIDLDQAKDLDKKKMAQELLKIIIQKMPVDKNGDLVFDVDEATEIHNNAVRMLGRAIGIDVLTTFADVDVADLSNTSNNTVSDDLQRVERAVYNEAGVSQMQFNTDGNIALEKSILNDEASIYSLVAQFESFLNDVIEKWNRKAAKYYYRVQILTTTVYNYKEMAKLYKEQTQLGYSKMLPQIALGQSQSSILANAYFENDVLDLVHVFIPPLMSSTMNAEAINGTTQKKTQGEDTGSTGGRPEKADDQKSEKTIQNEESQS